MFLWWRKSDCGTSEGQRAFQGNEQHRKEDEWVKRESEHITAGLMKLKLLWQRQTL